MGLTKQATKKKLFIPQRGGTESAITLLQLDKAKRSFCLVLEYDGREQVKQFKCIKSIGMQRAAKIRKSKFMLVRDNWKSANVQLKPKLENGLVVVCALPKYREKVGLNIYYVSLSPPDNIKKIKKDVRLLHSKYQDEKMLDLNNDCFAEKIQVM